VVAITSWGVVVSILLLSVAVYGVIRQKHQVGACSRELSSTIDEAKAVCGELEVIMENAVNISRSITDEFDHRINGLTRVLSAEAREVVEELPAKTGAHKPRGGDEPSKIRVYQLAREMHVSSKEMVNIIKQMGIPISNHMNALDEEQVDEIKKRMASGAGDFRSCLLNEMSAGKPLVHPADNNAQDSARLIEKAGTSEEDAKSTLGFSLEELRNAHPYIAVRTLSEKGYSVRDIAKMLGRGQGEVSLIMNLSKKKYACI